MSSHIDGLPARYEGIQSNFALISFDVEEDRMLFFTIASKLAIGNSFFAKKGSHVACFWSSITKSHTNFILLRKYDKKLGTIMRSMYPALYIKFPLEFYCLEIKQIEN